LKIVISYPSVHRAIAERLKIALEAEDHDVFFDRDDLPPGESFHHAIRNAIDAADLFVFMISPEAVAPGSYTLAELGCAERRWPRASGHVLPVMVTPTPRATIPAYLLSVTLLEPRGDLVAETVARVAEMASPRGRARRMAVGASVGAVLVIAAGYVGWRELDQHQTATRLAENARRAFDLCRDSPAEGFAQLAALAATNGAPQSVRIAEEDCAMSWLRRARITAGQSTFEQLVTPLKPVLSQALIDGAGGVRAADLYAHLGWADALIRRDGRTTTPDPEASYRRALEADSTNVYGHAMWAHWMLLNGTSRRQLALEHFDAAVASGRDTPFVRALELGAMVTSEALGMDALRVLDDMRRRGEPLDPRQKQRVWSALYSLAVRESEARRLTEALPPEDGLATFRWLFAREDLDASQHRLWRFINGLLLLRAGRAAEARPDLQALQRERRAEGATGSMLDGVDRLLARR